MIIEVVSTFKFKQTIKLILTPIFSVLCMQQLKQRTQNKCLRKCETLAMEDKTTFGGYFCPALAKAV
ncbi:hypothetical protein P8452_42398 [Trifolium repens]|nr:hypothetical protein P8452_42398 [Trifolium repens]